MDGEGLTGTCLSIGKDTNIVSIDSTLNQPLCLLKDFLLGTIRPKDRVEVVVFLTGALSDLDRHLIRHPIAVNELLWVLLLSCREWPDSTVDSDFTFHVLKLIEKLLPLLLLLLVSVLNDIQLLGDFLDTLLGSKVFLLELSSLTCCL